MSGATLLQNDYDQMITNHTFKKDKQGLADNQSKQIIVLFCCLTKPRKSEPSSLETNGPAELPKG